MLKSLLTASAVALTFASSAFADVAANKALVAEALGKVFGQGDVSAVDQYFTPDYIQHNLGAPTGAEGLKGLVGYLSQNPNFKAIPHRIIGEGDFVATHTTYEGFAEVPLVAFDVFRIEDGKIAEHWDNLTPQTPPNPSGRTQTDGATEITDLDKTEENKAKVLDLLVKAFIRGEKVDFTQYISPVTYIQHNSMAADGLEGLGAMIQEMAEKGIKMVYDKVHYVVAEGNFVLTLSEGTLADKPTAFYDLFRLEDGLIVEHWDVIAEIEPKSEWKNNNGKF